MLFCGNEEMMCCSQKIKGCLTTTNEELVISHYKSRNLGSLFYWVALPATNISSKLMWLTFLIGSYLDQITLDLFSGTIMTFFHDSSIQHPTTQTLTFKSHIPPQTHPDEIMTPTIWSFNFSHPKSLDKWKTIPLKAQICQIQSINSQMIAKEMKTPPQ